MSLSSSRRKNKPKKESIYREVSSGRFIGIRTINEIEDIIDTSEVYMTDPTVIFNNDNTKVLFYYNTKNSNEIEEMETLFKNTVKSKSTITLSDAFYLNESSGDDDTYDYSGTYRFEKYDEKTKTIVAAPLSINKQSTTYSTLYPRFWLGSLLWTTSDAITTRTTSYEIVNFMGNNSEQSFSSVLGTIEENDHIEIVGVGTYTVESYRTDTDKGWERIKVKEIISETDFLGELTFIRLLRPDGDKFKSNTPEENPPTTWVPPMRGTPEYDAYREELDAPSNEGRWWINPMSDKTPSGTTPYQQSDLEILRSQGSRIAGSPNIEEELRQSGMSSSGINKVLRQRQKLERAQTQKLFEPQITEEQLPPQSKKDKAKEKWLATGSHTLNITVTTTSTGNKFSINGKYGDDIEIDAGATVLVKQTDKSNGIAGHTKQHHPFRFSTIEDGIHRGKRALPIEYNTGKKVGTGGSYYYFTVPSADKLFYYCEHHKNMGGRLRVAREKGACCSPLPCGGADSGKCFDNVSEWKCTNISQHDGKWHKDAKCPRQGLGARRGCCVGDNPQPSERSSIYYGPSSSASGQSSSASGRRNERKDTITQTRGFNNPAHRDLPQDTIGTGVCCFNDSCVKMKKKNCSVFGGIWLGEVDCVTESGRNICAQYKIGACCTNTGTDENECTCTRTNKAQCPDGTWMSNAQCPNHPLGVNPCCPQDNVEIGKCCSGKECNGYDLPRCHDVTAYKCAMRRGKWTAITEDSPGCEGNDCCGAIITP